MLLENLVFTQRKASSCSPQPALRNHQIEIRKTRMRIENLVAHNVEPLQVFLSLRSRHIDQKDAHAP
jgi:hypothetical protein